MKTIEQRFWDKVPMREDGKCWLWHGAKDIKGYGVLRIGDMLIKAHRYAYQYVNGNISECEFVCHTCDNPSCVNPSHLWVGTHYDNMDDKIAKGRQHKPSGDTNPNAKMTDDKILIVRDMINSGATCQSVADHFGVSRSCINHIKNNHTWKIDADQ